MLSKKLIYANHCYYLNVRGEIDKSCLCFLCVRFLMMMVIALCPCNKKTTTKKNCPMRKTNLALKKLLIVCVSYHSYSIRNKKGGKRLLACGEVQVCLLVSVARTSTTPCCVASRGYSHFGSELLAAASVCWGRRWLTIQR